VLLATRTDGHPPGLRVAFAEADELAAVDPPGPAAIAVAGEALPRAAAQKRAWRDRIAAAWGAQTPLADEVWAEVAFATAGSIAGPLEPALDALEPVLGRDPRGGRQEFFPNDHLIVWLRVCRAAPGAPPVRLRLGACS
jgi:hypothetical protein